MGEAPSRFWPLAAMVALVAVLLYARTWSYDYTYLDDHQLILDQQSFLERPSSLYRVFTRSYFGGKSNTYYRPLINLSLVVDAGWSGLRPFGYHFTNVALHAVVCVLLLRFLLEFGFGKLPSLWAALVFATHPVHAASVAWIPGRNDLILGGFALGACLCLVRDRKHPALIPKAGHLVCLFGALFSKETALCLPLLCLVLLWGLWGAKSLLSQRWLWAGWAGALALYFATRFAVLAGPPAIGTARVQPALENWPVLLSDLGKLLLPVRLQVLAAPEDTQAWPGVVGVLVLVIAIRFGLVRGMRRRVVVLGLVFVLFPLLVGLAGATVVVLENRLYLAAVGISLLLGEGLRAAGAWRPRFARALMAVAALVPLVFGVLALRHSANFRDRERFSEAAILASPHSGIAANLMHRRFLPGPPASTGW